MCEVKRERELHDPAFFAQSVSHTDQMGKALAMLPPPCLVHANFRLSAVTSRITQVVVGALDDTVLLWKHMGDQGQAARAGWLAFTGRIGG